MHTMNILMNTIDIGFVLILIIFTLYLVREVKSIRQDLHDHQKKLLLMEIEILNLKEINYQLEGDILDLKSNHNFIYQQLRLIDHKNN